MTAETNSNEPKAKQLELTEKTIKRTGDALTSMLEEISKRPIKRPAEELIRHHIEIINALSEKGATLPQIFERMDKAVHLGISSNSFGAYVRRIRKEMGISNVQRKAQKQTAKDKTEAAPAARPETNSAPAVQQETIYANAWNCPECETKAVRRESTKTPGNFFWQCQKCGKNYKDNNGKLTNERM